MNTLFIVSGSVSEYLSIKCLTAASRKSWKIFDIQRVILEDI